MQEYWIGLLCPPPGHLPDPGIEPVSPASTGRFFTTEPPGKRIVNNTVLYMWKFLREYLFNCILFFNFTILYWFCHISKWICHRYTCVPHPEPSSLLPPHTIPLGHPNNPVYETAKQTLMYRTVFWTLWERERVGWFGSIYIFLKWGIVVVGFPGSSDDKESACNVGDLGLIT